MSLVTRPAALPVYGRLVGKRVGSDSCCLQYTNSVRKVADTYVSAATICPAISTSSDADRCSQQVLLPMVFDHYTPAQSQGRSSDGLLWTRLALSRNGVDFSYVSRAPYVERGLGR